MTTDLTQDVPRSPFAAIDGIEWLPRLIDKLRAAQAGTLGSYSRFPSGGDRSFIGHFGLDADGLATVIRSGATDDEVAAWVKAHMTGGEDVIQQWAAHQRQAQRGFLAIFVKLMRLPLKAKLQARHPGVPLSRIDSFAKALALDEGHPIEGL